MSFLDPHDRRPKEQRSSVERHLHQAEARIHYLESLMEGAYSLMDRYSDEISDEAFHEIEALFSQGLGFDAPGSSRLDELEAEVERLRDACSDVQDCVEERREHHRSHETQTVCEIILGILDEHDALDAAEDGGDE